MLGPRLLPRCRRPARAATSPRNRWWQSSSQPSPRTTSSSVSPRTNSSSSRGPSARS